MNGACRQTATLPTTRPTARASTVRDPPTVNVWTRTRAASSAGGISARQPFEPRSRPHPGEPDEADGLEQVGPDGQHADRSPGHESTSLDPASSGRADEVAGHDADRGQEHGDPRRHERHRHDGDRAADGGRDAGRPDGAGGGPSSATNPAGNAASRPSVAGSPIAPPPSAPTRVPRFQKTNTDRPVSQKARSVSSGWAVAMAVDSSITSWAATSRRGSEPRIRRDEADAVHAVAGGEQQGRADGGRRWCRRCR